MLGESFAAVRPEPFVRFGEWENPRWDLVVDEENRDVFSVAVAAETGDLVRNGTDGNEDDTNNDNNNNNHYENSVCSRYPHKTASYPDWSRLGIMTNTGSWPEKSVQSRGAQARTEPLKVATVS